MSAAVMGLPTIQAAIEREVLIPIHNAANQTALDVRTLLSRSSQKRPATPSQKLKVLKKGSFRGAVGVQRPAINAVRPAQSIGAQRTTRRIP